jgi:hypothetical protein
MSEQDDELPEGWALRKAPEKGGWEARKRFSILDADVVFAETAADCRAKAWAVYMKAQAEIEPVAHRVAEGTGGKQRTHTPRETESIPPALRDVPKEPEKDLEWNGFDSGGTWDLRPSGWMMVKIGDSVHEGHFSRQPQFDADEALLLSLICEALLRGSNPTHVVRSGKFASLARKVQDMKRLAAESK